MSKKVSIILILLSFLLLLGLDFAYAVDGCCINPNSVYFCSATQATETQCCGTGNPSCISNQFLQNQDCPETGYCLGTARGCCRNTCTAAQISGIMTPLACSDPSYFTTSECTSYSECSQGCYFCLGDTQSRGYGTLQYATTDCASIRKVLGFFNYTASSDQCNTLSPPQFQLFALGGTVKNSTDNSLVEGATVAILGLTATTDSSGAFSFQSIPKGNYTITAYKDGFFENKTNISITDNLAGVGIGIKQVPKRNLIVHVQDSAGTPIENANVLVNQMNVQQTDAFGNFTFSNLDVNQSNSLPKQYAITASANELSASTITTLTANPTRVTLTLTTAAENAANISGYVLSVDENGNNITLGNVAVSIAGKAVASTSNGFYSIENITAGIYTAYLTPNAPYLAGQQIVNVQPGQNPGKNLSVQRGAPGNVANATIVVKNNAGGFVSGASVSIKQIGSALPSFEGSTSSAGNVSAMLQKTTYEVTISKPGFSVIRPVISVAQDETFTFVITPVSLAMYKVMGYVINSTLQRGMPQATVYIDGFRWTISGQDGYYEFFLVPEGNHIVKAEKSGYLSDSANILVTADTEKNLTLGNAGCVGTLGNPVIENLSLNKSSVIVNFRAACEASGSYVYRCEGDVCIPVAITNILPSETTQYIDADVKPNTLYWYEVHTIHENPFVQEKVSGRASIFTGLEPCFASDGEFCLNNKRSVCNESNYINNVGISPIDPLCLAKNETATEYVSKLNCSVECNKPLGMFSVVGQLPISTIGGNVNAPCSSGDFAAYPSLKSCYKDFEATAVDRYFSCENVSSCYDYHSKGSCEENRCAKQMSCEWRPYLQDLSLGVCMPAEEKFQNCSRCDISDKYNNLFGACNKEICDLYGGNTDDNTHSCYFYDSKCQDKKVLSCQHYGTSKDECIGPVPDNVSVKVDAGATNEILAKSNDLLGFGLCRFNVTNLLGRCAKDANEDLRADQNPVDMLPPETVIIHPTAAKEINFPVVVYDDENKTSQVYDATTYYSVGASFIYPYIQSENSRIVAPTLPDGLWNVYFFSKDAADNLEVVKSFPILIDQTKPIVNFSYVYSEGVLTTSLSSTEVLRCTAKLNSEAGQNIDLASNLVNEVGISFVKSYTVSDGIYFYPYTCLDWVGNEVSGTALIVVDTEGFFYNLQPNGTISKSGTMEISMDTKADANCRYLDADPLETGIFSQTNISNYPYDSMTPFPPTQTGGTHHSASVTISSNSIAKKYFLRCVITQSMSTTSSNISAIRFTVDRVAPNTTLYDSWGYDITYLSVFNTSTWRKQALVKLKCSDPPSPAILPTPDYTPREFGCRQLYYCIGLESTCTPQGAVINISPTNQTPLTEIDLFINSSSNLCYYSKDNGNNTGIQNCTLIRIDRIAPNIVITSDDMTPDGRVREQFVNITGVVNNVAYWADSVEQIPDYFGTFNLTATVKSANVSEVKFDWKSSDSYDYVALDFIGNTISYGTKGPAPAVVSGNLAPNVPAKIKVEVDPDDHSQAKIYVDDTYIDAISRISTEGRIIFSNKTFSGILITDNSTTSPLQEWNVTVLVDGDATGQKLSIHSDGTFGGIVSIAKLLSKPPTFSGTVELQATDMAGNVGSKQFDVTIDRFGPGVAPRIDPPMNRDLNSYLENYMWLDYPLYYDNGIYYFGGTPYGGGILGYISGNTSEYGVYLELWNDTDNMLNYTQPAYSNYTELSGYGDLFKVTATADAGTNNISAPLGAGAIINNLAGTKYIAFSGHHRTDYGHYKKYYQIANVTIVPNLKTIINLTEPLEKKVNYLETFTIANMNLTPDRFEFAQILPNISYYETFWHIEQFDDLGNPGLRTDTLHIIIDAVRPEIIFASPYTDKDGIGTLPESGKQNGRYVLQNLTGIKIIVDEHGTGLRNESVNLTINGVKKTPKVNVTYSFERHTTYLINYTPYLSDGDYDIMFNVRDKANNKAEIKDWKIRIDSTLPQQPYFTVTNGVNISYAPDDYTFVSDVPEINVSYPDANIVSIVRARVRKSSSWLDFVVVNCTRTNPVNNIFGCILTANQSLIPPEFTLEGDYTIEFLSVKNYSDGTTSASAKHYFLFSNDVTAPDITSFGVDRKFINSQSSLGFSAFVSNEDEHYLKINLSINGNVLESNSARIVDSKITGYVSGEKMLSANLQDNTTYPVNLIATDYAGNTNDLAFSNITIDDTAPAFSSEDINVSAHPIYYYHAIVGTVEKTEYFVREDLIQIFGKVPADTVRLSFYRLNDKGGFDFLYTIQDCASSSGGPCIFNGTFSIETKSFITGKVGESTQNLIKITATDRADNEFSVSKLIYKDVENPTIIICTQTECSAAETTETLPITNVNDMKTDCKTDLACYDKLISAACKNPILGITNASCYKGYVLAINEETFFGLCNNIPIARDDCLYDLAKGTDASIICGEIAATITQKYCYEWFTNR